MELAGWPADGRAFVFVGLMSLFIAALTAAAYRAAQGPDPGPPLFHPPRRPPRPDAPPWAPEAERAATWLEAGRPLEALQAYRAHVASRPGDADALFNMGHACFQLRLYAQARLCWRGVRRLEPHAADAKTNLRLMKRLLAAEKVRRPVALLGPGDAETA